MTINKTATPPAMAMFLPVKAEVLGVRDPLADKEFIRASSSEVSVVMELPIPMMPLDISPNPDVRPSPILPNPVVRPEPTTSNPPEIVEPTVPKPLLMSPKPSFNPSPMVSNPPDISPLKSVSPEDTVDDKVVTDVDKFVTPVPTAFTLLLTDVEIDFSASATAD